MQEYACPKCVGRTAKPNLEEKAAALTEAAFKAIFHTGNGTTVEDAYQYWESEWKQELKDEVAAKLRALLVEWDDGGHREEAGSVAETRARNHPL